MNKVELAGNLGREPTIKYTPQGTMVCTNSLATSNDYKDKTTGEWVKKPPFWHRLVAFGKTAEDLSTYGKGQKIKVVGKIAYREWTDKDGVKRNVTEINVFYAGDDSKKQESGGYDAPDGDDSDVPF